MVAERHVKGDVGEALLDALEEDLRVLEVVLPRLHPDVVGRSVAREHDVVDVVGVSLAASMRTTGMSLDS